MKKLICVILVMLTLVCSLTACKFTQNMSGALAGNAESTPKAEEMMAALTQSRLADAKALLHPAAEENADTAITQMSDYLAGREVSTLKLQNINVKTTTGTSGKTTQEQAAYKVTLSDNSIVYINAVYLTNDDGAGFVSFQLVLGIV